jgi:hypothetical protein
VFFFDDDGMQKSLPRGWTSEADPDAFVAVAAGRSRFRLEDLLALAGIVERLAERRPRRRGVRRTLP